MKILFIILIALASSNGSKNIAFVDDSSANIAIATSAIIEKDFVADSQNFAFWMLGNRNKKVDSIVNDVIKITNKFATIKLTEYQWNTNWGSVYTMEGLFIALDSISTLHFVIEKEIFKYSSNEKFLIYCHGSSIEEISKSNLTSVTNKNVNFVIDDGKEISLAQSFGFTNEKCNVPQLKVINTFDSEKRRWRKPNIFFVKYDNFHGCEIVIGVPILGLFPEAYWLYLHDEKPTGPFIDLFELAARKFNFTISYKLCSANLKFCNTPLTLTSTSTYVDHFFYHPEYFLETIFIPSNIIGHNDVVYFAPSRKILSSLEKLFRPLQLEVWCAMTATMLIGFLCIQVINRLPPEIQELVHGENVRTPGLNLLTTFVSNSQDFD